MSRAQQAISNDGVGFATNAPLASDNPDINSHDISAALDQRFEHRLAEHLLPVNDNTHGKASQIPPGREGAKANPVKEAAARLSADSTNSRRMGRHIDCLGELAGPGPTTFRCSCKLSRLNQDQVRVACRPLCGSYHIETCRTLPTAYVK